VPRVMLHSTELRVAHPDSGELCTFLADLPEDFRMLQEGLR